MKYSGKYADAGFGDAPLLTVYFNPFHAAAGGILFKNIPAEVFLFQLQQPDFTAQAFMRSVRSIFVLIVINCWIVRIAHKSHGFPWDSQAAFGFGTDGNIFHVLPQCILDKPIQLMPAVVSNLIAQEATADAQFNLHGLPYNPVFSCSG